MKGLIPSLMSTAEAERSFSRLKLIKTSKKHHSHLFSVLFAGLSAFLLWYLGQMIIRLWCCWKDSLFSFMNRSCETAAVNISWYIRYSNYNLSVQATLDTTVVFILFVPFSYFKISRKKTRERLLSSSCFACLMLVWCYCATYSLGMCRLLRYMAASKINLQELQTTQAKINKPRNKKWIPNLSFHRGSWVCMPHAFSDLYHFLRCSLFFSHWCDGEVKVETNSFAGECKVVVCQHCWSLHCQGQVDHKVYEYRNPWV